MNQINARRVRVLVFPCGAENGSEIFRALRYSVHVELFGASSVDDHGRFNFENYCGQLPRISEPEFLSELCALVESWGIDLLFPTHDSVCELLAANTDRLSCHVVNGDPITASVTRSKRATYELFADQKWVPAMYELGGAALPWPIIVKPDQGQGGQGIQLVSTAEEAHHVLGRTDSPLLVEYLPGDELTVDCFTDRRGGLVFVGPRTRERVRAGIAMRSRCLDEDSSISAMAQEINRRLRFRGPWFFQTKRDKFNDWKLLEVSCRVAGSMVVQRCRGVNLPLLCVLDYMGRDVIALPQRSVSMADRTVTTRTEISFSFDSIFIDLDDTLIIGEYAVPTALAFLYLMISKGKRVTLITRHVGDVLSALESARISPNLFDQIIHLKHEEDKGDFVTADAIFIDNHFAERLAVSRKVGVPVFDVDSLEFFL